MKKRILVVSQHYWPENFRITDICEGFTQNEIEVDLLCGLPNYPKGDWSEGYSYFGPRRETHGGVNIYRSGEIPRKGNTSLTIFLNYISFPFFATFNLVRLFGKKYDAVFCYETSPVLMIWPAMLYAKTHRIPLTTYVLDLWPENLYSVVDFKNKILRGVAYSVSTWLYKKSDRLIAMSPSLGETLAERTKKDAENITVIPQYCEAFYRQDILDDELTKRFSDKFNVVFAGNFSPAQGLEGLIEVAQNLADKGINDIRFILVGDGMSRESLLSSISERGLSDYFAWEGSHPATEMPRYHTMADALVACLTKSDFIGLTTPAKITSYMAAAKPILCSMDGEGAAVINNAHCGFTCSAGDSFALTENLIQLYNLPKPERVAMGNRAREYHDKYFDRTNLLAELENFILRGK